MSPLEERLTAELSELRAQNARLTALLEQQGAALARLAAAQPAKPTITVAELFERFERTQQRARSWAVARRRLSPLVRRLGSLPATDLTPMVWAEHRAARAAEAFTVDAQLRPRFPSVRTLNFELDRAKQLLNFAVSGRLLDANPLAAARGERCRVGRETYLDEIHLGRLLEAATPLIRAFTLICIDTGLRFNECRRLRREWIGLEGTVRVPGEITKSRKGRLVRLTRRALDALGEIAIEGCAEYFVNPKSGRLYSQRHMRRLFRDACLLSGVDQRVADGDIRLRPHDLRHSAASAALRRGASVAAVQRLLGHTSLAITSRYLHTDETEVAQIAQLMQDGAARETAAGGPL